MEGDRTVPKLRRFAGYDYTRGCTIFITFTLGRRVPVLSRVEGDRVVYLPAGEAFHATLLRELTRHPDLIRLKSFVIMPDHVHMRLYLTPGQASALRTLGQFVANLKRWSIYRAGQAGVTIDWQENYHDRICLTREIWERVDRYIGYNPLKWSLMHGANPPLKVHEMLDSPLIPQGEYWSGVGRVDLLSGKMRICVLQLSRRIPEGDYEAILNDLRRVAKAGYVFASTFISPLERRLFDLLIRSKLAVIHAVPDELQSVYRPKDHEPRLFAEDRYLMLSRLAAPGMTRSQAWHSLNAALGAQAQMHGGLFLYIKSRADSASAC